MSQFCSSRKFAIKVLLVLAMTCPFNILHSQTKSSNIPNVAVLGFSGINLSPADADIITKDFESQLVKSRKFNILDRNNIDNILREHELRLSGLTETENAVKIGQLLNVQYVFSGTFSKLDNTFILTANMINIQTGKIEKTASKTSDCQTAKEMLNMTSWAAYSFSDFGVGYELFWDGNRVGFEPDWTFLEAKKNLQWNKEHNKQYKVEGYYNGKKMH